MFLSVLVAECNEACGELSYSGPWCFNGPVNSTFWNSEVVKCYAVFHDRVNFTVAQDICLHCPVEGAFGQLIYYWTDPPELSYSM